MKLGDIKLICKLQCSSPTFPSLKLTPVLCKLTVALVDGALGCIAISGFSKDIVVGEVLMVKSNRAEHDTVRVHTGVTAGITPGQENEQHSKNLYLPHCFECVCAQHKHAACKKLCLQKVSPESLKKPSSYAMSVVKCIH